MLDRKCAYCGKVFSHSVMLIHEEQCKAEQEKKGKEDKNVKKKVKSGSV